MTVAWGAGVAVRRTLTRSALERLGQAVVNQAGADCRILDNTDGTARTFETVTSTRHQIGGVQVRGCTAR